MTRWVPPIADPLAELLIVISETCPALFLRAAALWLAYRR